MPQWYCGIQGNQYGPVDDATIRAWISQGRVTARDFVWCEGMSEWRPAAEQFPDMFQAGGAGVYGAAAPGLVPVLPPGGTNGATPNGQLTAQARGVLNGRWGLPIGFCLLAWLLQAACGMVPYIGGLVQLVLSGAFQLGVAVFFLTFTRGGRPELGMLFIGFKNFGNALGTVLLTALLVIAWALLGASAGIVVMLLGALAREPAIAIVGVFLMIPGQVLAIVKQLSYSQALYVLADDSNIGPLNAIRQSVQIMNGNKAKLFLLWLVFFLWSLLCILTLGIGFLWLSPYMATSYARFYDDLQPPRQVQVAAMPSVVTPTFG